jgi:hypothetical protein
LQWIRRKPAPCLLSLFSKLPQPLLFNEGGAILEKKKKFFRRRT